MEVSGGSRQVLSRHFEPGFDLAPERFTALEEALERVRADLRVMEALWRVWPVCPAPVPGVRAQERSGVPVWWGVGDGGHVAAAIGQWTG